MKRSRHTISKRWIKYGEKTTTDDITCVICPIRTTEYDTKGDFTVAPGKGTTTTMYYRCNTARCPAKAVVTLDNTKKKRVGDIVKKGEHSTSDCDVEYEDFYKQYPLSIDTQLSNKKHNSVQNSIVGVDTGVIKKNWRQYGLKMLKKTDDCDPAIKRYYLRCQTHGCRCKARVDVNTSEGRMDSIRIYGTHTQKERCDVECTYLKNGANFISSMAHQKDNYDNENTNVESNIEKLSPKVVDVTDEVQSRNNKDENMGIATEEWLFDSGSILSMDECINMIDFTTWFNSNSPFPTEV